MKFVILCALIFAVVVNGGYPSDFPRCKNGDEACLVKAANDVIQHYADGLGDINLSPLEPFRVEEYYMPADDKSPVNIEMKLKGVELKGFKTMKVNKFQGLKADMSGRNTFSAVIPTLKVSSHYSINGKILILPITGDGLSEMTCKNLAFTYSWDFKPVEKDGKIYATLEHVKLEVKPEQVHFIMENLFNGDKALGEATNEFINQNWQEMYGYLEKPMTKKISLLAKSFINNFFEHQPYADFFV